MLEAFGADAQILVKAVSSIFVIGLVFILAKYLLRLLIPGVLLYFAYMLFSSGHPLFGLIIGAGGLALGIYSIMDDDESDGF